MAASIAGKEETRGDSRFCGRRGGGKGGRPPARAPGGPARISPPPPAPSSPPEPSPPLRRAPEARGTHRQASARRRFGTEMKRRILTWGRHEGDGRDDVDEREAAAGGDHGGGGPPRRAAAAAAVPAHGHRDLGTPAG